MALAAVGLLVVTAIGCSNANGPEHSKEYQSSVQLLNEHNYEGAIAGLEALAVQHQNSPEVQRKLMHAYAGASGFEAVKFKNIVDGISNRHKKVANQVEDQVERFKRKFTGGLFQLEHSLKYRTWRTIQVLERNLDGVPVLDSRQYRRLEQAIEVYDRLGQDPMTSSKEDNFQWGVLYGYRILVHAKYLAKELKGIAEEEGEPVTEREMEQRILSHMKVISRDSLKAYKLFRNSYDKIQRIVNKTESFLEEVTGRRINARLLAEADSVEGLVLDFIEANKELSADLVAQLKDRLETADLDGNVKYAFREFRPESLEVRFNRQRIRATLRVYWKELEPRPETAELRQLLAGMRKDLATAYAQAVQEGSLDPLRKLRRDDRSAFSHAMDLADVLGRDVNLAEVRADLRPAALALRDLVDREHLRLTIQDAKELGKESKELAHESRQAHEDLLKHTLVRLKGRVRNADAILQEARDAGSPLEGELRTSDSDLKKKVQEQVDHAQEYLDSN